MMGHVVGHSDAIIEKEMACTDCWEQIKRSWEMLLALSRISADQETAASMSSTVPAFTRNVAMRKATVATVTAKRVRFH